MIFPRITLVFTFTVNINIFELQFWIELPLKLENQSIQIKVLVCDSECPHDILIGRTSLAHLSAWQDYSTNKLYIQQISIPIVAKNNVRILPGCIGIVSAALKMGRSNFIPQNTIMGKAIAYVRPFDKTLPLGPIETIQTFSNQSIFT